MMVWRREIDSDILSLRKKASRDPAEEPRDIMIGAVAAGLGAKRDGRAAGPMSGSPSEVSRNNHGEKEFQSGGRWCA